MNTSELGQIRTAVQARMASWQALRDYLLVVRKELEGSANRKQWGIQGELQRVPKQPGVSLRTYGDIQGDAIACKDVADYVQKMEEDPRLTLACVGDLICGGPSQIEVLLLFLVTMLKWPNRVFVSKGNCDINTTIMMTEGLTEWVYKHWVKKGGGNEAYEHVAPLVSSVMKLLPTWVFFEGPSVFMVHGGPMRPVWCMEDLQLPDSDTLDIEARFRADLKGYEAPIQPNYLDARMRHFGPDKVSQFLDVTGASGIIRGHESSKLEKAGAGFEIDCDGAMATIHSCHKAPDRRVWVWDLGGHHEAFEPDEFETFGQ